MIWQEVEVAQIFYKVKVSIKSQLLTDDIALKGGIAKGYKTPQAKQIRKGDTTQMQQVMLMVIRT